MSRRTNTLGGAVCHSVSVPEFEKRSSNSEKRLLSYLSGADGPGESGGARRRPEETGGGAGRPAGRALRSPGLARRRVTRSPGGLSLKHWRAGGEAHQSGGCCGGAQAPRPARMTRRWSAGVPWRATGGARRLAPAGVSHYSGVAENKSGIPGDVPQSLGEVPLSQVKSRAMKWRFRSGTRIRHSVFLNRFQR